MFEEFQTESLTLMSAFDDARYIGKHDRRVIVKTGHTKMRFEGRKGKIGDLGPSR